MVLICGAIQAEIRGLLDLLGDRDCSLIGRKPHYRGHLFGYPLRVMETGVGLANAAQALTAAIEHSRPRLILQIGCAGVFRETGLDIGDVAVATEEIDVQLGVEPQSHTDMPTELPFPILRQHGQAYTHRYPLASPESLSAARLIADALPSQGVNVAQGPFITVSTITASDDRARRLYEAWRPCMESMEGAGAAVVSLLYHIPLVEIRSASNFTGRRERDQWRIPLACDRATQAAIIFLNEFTKRSRQ